MYCYWLVGPLRGNRGRTGTAWAAMEALPRSDRISRGEAESPDGGDEARLPGVGPEAPPSVAREYGGRSWWRVERFMTSIQMHPPPAGQGRFICPDESLTSSQPRGVRV